MLLLYTIFTMNNTNTNNLSKYNGYYHSKEYQVNINENKINSYNVNSDSKNNINTNNDSINTNLDNISSDSKYNINNNPDEKHSNDSDEKHNTNLDEKHNNNNNNINNIDNYSDSKCEMNYSDNKYPSPSKCDKEYKEYVVRPSSLTFDALLNIARKNYGNPTAGYYIFDHKTDYYDTNSKLYNNNCNITNSSNNTASSANIGL